MINHDSDVSIAMLGLLQTLVLGEMGEVNAAFLNKVCPQLELSLNQFEEVPSNCKDPEQAAELCTMVTQLKETLKAVPPVEMNTLKKVLELWNANEGAIESTIVRMYFRI